MAVLRYIAPALAAAGYAAAATCSAATTTIQNSGDATALASCRTFTGSIAIATGTTGNIALDGIEVITGSLIAENATQLTALSGDSLTTIQDTFELTSLTILSTLNFPLLSSVATVTWTTLSQLQGLSFQTGLQMVKSLTISDTQLNALTGIDLQVADVIEINNNGYLKEINMQLANVTQSLDINGNAPSLAVTLPNLIWANDVTIRDAQSVLIPSLSAVNGSLGLYSNSFQSLTAPNLTTVGQTLAVDENNMLTNATFPELKTLGGGLQLQNNTIWSQINGFPALQRVVGAVDIYGNFSVVSLPQINYVRGDFNLQSKQDITSTCDHFKSLSGTGNYIQGTYTCAGNQDDPNTTGTLTPGTNSGNGDNTSSGSGASASGSGKKNAAGALTVPGVTGMLGVVAAVFGLLL